MSYCQLPAGISLLPWKLFRGLPPTSTTEEDLQDLEYFKAIAKSIDPRIPEDLYLRRNVLCCFSQRCQLDDYTKEASDAWYDKKAFRNKFICDTHSQRIEKNGGERHQLNRKILKFVHLHLYLRMAEEISRGDGTSFWVVRDPAGFELWPYSDTPCSTSFAHKVHGKPMYTGFPPQDENPDPLSFNLAHCNIALQSWQFNASVGTSNPPYDAAVNRLRNIRTAGMEKYWDIKLKEIEEDSNPMTGIPFIFERFYWLERNYRARAATQKAQIDDQHSSPATE